MVPSGKTPDFKQNSFTNHKTISDPCDKIKKNKCGQKVATLFYCRY